MLTVKQAAEVLGVSPSLVYSLIAARELEHVRVGFGRGLIRIPEHSILDYQKRRAVPAVGVAVSRAPRPGPRLKHIDL